MVTEPPAAAPAAATPPAAHSPRAGSAGAAGFSDPLASPSGAGPPVVGIITEFVPGGSLAAFLRAGAAPLPLRLRCELALQAANGLAYLHELRLVHFDLKPDNLLLDGPPALVLAAARAGDACDAGGGAAADGAAGGGGVAEGVAVVGGGAGCSAAAIAEAHAHTRASSPALGGGRAGSATSSGSHPHVARSASSSSRQEAAALARAVATGWAPIVKVADFGLSRHKLDGYVSSSRRGVTGSVTGDVTGATAAASSSITSSAALPYAAPELVADPERVSEKADVWSLGVVMWEMAARTAPHQVGAGLKFLLFAWWFDLLLASAVIEGGFLPLPRCLTPPLITRSPPPPPAPPQDLTPQQILAGLAAGSLQLEVPPWCEHEWTGLIEACLEPNPANRPSMKDLARQLEAIRGQLVDEAGEGEG